MKRYSITYFIGQGLQGLWRNGVMTLASITVLMSCLLVMGSFGLLVYNININLDRLGALNDIVVFVDTTIKDEDTTDEQEEISYTTEIDASTDSAIEMLSIVSELNELDNFTSLDDALISINNISQRMSLLTVALEGLDTQRRAEETLYFNYLQSVYDTIAGRINSLKSIETRIKELDNVATVDLTSKAAGLAEMKELYSDYPTVFENYRNNSLPDRFTITYTDNSRVSALQYNLEHLDKMLYKVTCHSDVAQTMANLKNAVVIILGWFMLILFVVSLFVIINTIKLAVFSRRDEIAIMRFVGATNWFIALPFIIGGIIIGLCSSIIAYFAQYYIYDYVVNVIIGDFNGLIVASDFSAIKVIVFIGFIVIGLATGIIGSSVSLHRYSNK